MKKCHICGKRASIYLTQIINGQAKDLALCETCARNKGLFDPQALAFAEQFFPEAFRQKVDKIVKELIGQSETAQEKTLPRRNSTDLLTHCPSCGFSLDEFRQIGRLGCPDCYSVFADELNTDAEPGSETPTTEKATDSPAVRRSKLERQLQEAVEKEDYETAAQIRDRLKSMNE